MLNEKREPYSRENLALKIEEHPSRKVKKEESRVGREIVKFKMDVECSKDLAEKFLKEYFLALTEPKQTRLIDATADIYAKRPMKQSPDKSLIQEKACGPSESVHLLELSRWSGRVLIFLFVLVFISLSTLVGHTYLMYHKKQASERARQEATKMNSELYEAFLAQNLEILLGKLDELTAIPRMRRAFPEITSLPAIARFKRGPDLTRKASATVELLWRVKYLFDSWTGNPHAFAPELRPAEKEISLFLTLWTETEALLEHLERVREKPGEFFSVENR